MGEFFEKTSEQVSISIDRLFLDHFCYLGNTTVSNKNNDCNQTLGDPSSTNSFTHGLNRNISFSLS